MNTYRRFAVALGSISAMVVLSCTENGVVGRYIDDPGAPVDFANASEDSGTGRDARSAAAGYCPSNRCPPDTATCPSSQFFCDVDLLTDMDNCGECGNRCPRANNYVCAGGRCMLSCGPEAVTSRLDCDGIPDNGCETSAFSNDNCGSCGRVCPADKECIRRQGSQFVCGCMPGELHCPNPQRDLQCIDPSRDDENCGACGNVCANDGAVEVPPNMRFGCIDGACGLKCLPLFADCDGVADNGCETALVSDDDCGICGLRCGDDERCVMGVKPPATCVGPCGVGTTFCGSYVPLSCYVSGERCGGDSNGEDGPEILVGGCRDLSSDLGSCGACGNVCLDGQPTRHTSPRCDYGRCVYPCAAGWGDCNGYDFDGCETNLEFDPKNCGGCGLVCDGVAGQACVDGACMVEPCDELQDAGGPPR